MSEPYFSPQSVKDLKDILAFVSKDKPQVAVTFVASLKDKCYNLARFPGMGARRSELAEDLRALPVGNYVI